MKKILLTAAAAMLGATAMPAIAAPIVSADFSGGSYGGLTIETKRGAIQIATARPGFVICCQVTGSDAALDNPFAVFGTGQVQNVGSLFAEFQTIAGLVYNVSFRYGALGSGTDALYLSLNGVSSTLSVTAGSNIDTAFTTFTSSFVGTGSPTTISFSGRGPGTNIDVILDDVSVTSVPEPATWAMMLLGFGMVGFGLRSRRKITARVAYA